MLNGFSVTGTLTIFIVSAIITWFMGVTLAKATDTLDTRYKLGEALGGLILLGIACSLSEIAVVFSAAVNNHIPVIFGVILGGITIRTLSLALLDLVVSKKRPLSYLAGSPILFIETSFAMILAVIAFFGAFIPQKNALFGINPLSIALVVGYVAGLFIINKIRRKPNLNETNQDALPGRYHHERRAVENHKFFANKSNAYIIAIFIIAAIISLAAGTVLEASGAKIAGHFSIGTGIFAATAIAIVTSLPEISSAFESIMIGDNHLAVSDIMGGNAFMLTIFFIADLIYGKPILSFATRADTYLAILGIAMIGIYAISFISSHRQRYLRLGVDSITEIIVYGAGTYLVKIIK